MDMIDNLYGGGASDPIGLDHDDFVHDVQFDFYGNQLATCSSDHKIKIWRKVAPSRGQDYDPRSYQQ